MIIDNSEYSFLGEAVIKKSAVYGAVEHPSDDKVNWFFLQINGKRYTFFYKILEPNTAIYGEEFLLYMGFLMKDYVNSVINVSEEYMVYRGEELIGKIRVLKAV
ncbi:MAG: hypothetical protein ACO1PI_05820 [Bacteroidota bacterium]